MYKYDLLIHAYCIITWIYMLHSTHNTPLKLYINDGKHGLQAGKTFDHIYSLLLKNKQKQTYTLLFIR